MIDRLGVDPYGAFVCVYAFRVLVAAANRVITAVLSAGKRWNVSPGLASSYTFSSDMDRSSSLII